MREIERLLSVPTESVPDLNQSDWGDDEVLYSD